MYSCSGLEWWEEVVVDLLGAIDAQAINGIIRYKTSNPRVPDVSDRCILRSQVRQRDDVVAFPAL